MKKPLLYLLILLVTVFSTSCSQSSKETFEIGDKTFLLNGKPFVVKAAEIHYPRIPKEYWEHRIKMCKALGMNTICLYVFWNFHEPEEGKYDFTGQKDIAAFCRLAQENGMYVIVRPGPYVCAEWEMGGLPWWLLKKKDIKLREQDPLLDDTVIFKLQKKTVLIYIQKLFGRILVRQPVFFLNLDGHLLIREQLVRFSVNVSP